MDKIQAADFPEESKEELLGDWATIIMDSARDIRVVPIKEGTDQGGELILKENGKIIRPTREFISEDLKPEKVCPSQIQVKFEGEMLNPKQIPALRALKEYAGNNGKTLYISDLPIIEKPAKKKDIAAETPNFAGTTRLPEGIYTPTRLAQAISRAQIEAGFNIDVTSALRSPQKQAKLYAELKYTQAVAPPGTSYHDPIKGGIAIDVSNWQESKKYLARRGFMHGEPGKGPLFNDPWHFVYIYKG